MGTWHVLFAVLLALPGMALASGETPASGDPWGPEGLGGPLAEVGAAIGGLVVEMVTEGPTGWALHRVAVPQSDASLAPELPAVPEGPGVLFVLPSDAAVAESPDLPSLADFEPAEVAAPSLAPPTEVTGALDATLRGLLSIDAGAILLPLAAPPGASAAPARAPLLRPSDEGVEGSRGDEGHASTALLSGTALRRDDALLPRDAPMASSANAAGPAAVAAPALFESIPSAGKASLLALAAGLLLVIPILYHRLHQEQSLLHPGRQALYAAILARPGSTIQGASRAAGLSRGTALHHLRILTRNGLVQSQRGTKEVHLFPTGMRLESGEAAQRAALARPRACQIASRVLAHPGRTRMEVAQELGIAPSTLDWHLRHLRGQGLVDERLAGVRRELVPAPALSRILEEQSTAMPPRSAPTPLAA